MHLDKDTPVALGREVDRLRELHRLALAEHTDYPGLYADFLGTGLRMFDMELGIVSRIRGDEYQVLAVQPVGSGIATGDRFPLGETYCARVVGEDRFVAVPAAGRDPEMRRHPVYLARGLEAYIAAPIRVGGEIYGTLAFSSTREHAPFTEADRDLLELMARHLGNVIEQDLLESQREEAMNRLRETTELFESALEAAPIGMALVAPDGRFLRVNRAVAELFGYSEAELLRVDFQSLTHPDDLEADLALVRALLNGERRRYRLHKRYFHRDGHVIHALLSVAVVRDADDEASYFVSQIQDVTEQRRTEQALERQRQELAEANRRLEALVRIDPLTRVGNRRAFDERLRAELERAARSGQPVSLLLVDVDHFKRFNDAFGHAAGDEALARVATCLVEAARGTDCVARFGGEEFAVVLPETEADGACIVAERLRAAVARLEGLPRPVTVSIGASTYVPERRGKGAPSSARPLLNRADEALYAAKGGGRDQVRHLPLGAGEAPRDD